MRNLPLVTVLIPARNEEAAIERCLRAVLAQDYPHDRMEIVLADGRSVDATRAIAAELLGRGDVNWKMIENPIGSTPRNLNAGLKVASGIILCRVDARSLLPRGYVRQCVDVLLARDEVSVTGGAQVAVSVDGSLLSKGIVRALNNRYAMGGSRYRSGATSGPADTVYLGAFRVSDLRAIGGWNNAFETNQDFELNRRLGRSGHVWFDASLRVGYIPRTDLLALWRQYHRFGRWKVRYWRISQDPPRPRQAVMMALPVFALLAGAMTTARSGDRSRHGLAVGALVVGGLVVADHVGSQEPASPRQRVVSAAALCTVSCGWLSGVLREALVG